MELMVVAMLHKTDDSEWTEEELSPIKELNVMDITPGLAPLGASITLNNGEKYLVDFKNIDGKRSC